MGPDLGSLQSRCRWDDTEKPVDTGVTSGVETLFVWVWVSEGRLSWGRDTE